MSDNLKNSGAEPQGAEPQEPTSSGTDKNANEPSGQDTFDESVFDNPKLWTHPRFKSLNERAKRADQLETQMKKAEEDRLSQAKKFEELASLREKERDEIKSKYNQSLQDNRIIQESTKLGVVDIEAVLKLISRDSISIDENGNVLGVIEAVSSLSQNKPYLFGKKGNATMGTATNPPADADASFPRFKLSQLSDPVFYRENEEKILKAIKMNLVEDDVTK